MKALLKYRPDLRAFELENRLVPAIPGLGATVLTPGGYVLLLSPFPVSVADPFGASGSPGFLTPSAMTGSGGISGLLPANTTGVPALATLAPTGSNGGAAATIAVGSGADDSSAPIIPPVTRNTIANDAVNAAPVVGHASGDRSAVLPPERVYRGGFPVTARGGSSMEVPGQRAAQEAAQGPVDPVPLRLRRRPHRLASGASGNLIRSHADRAP
jgi:hypothetical protein